jgi:predicted HicB family RNase H-like nuclease
MKTDRMEIRIPPELKKQAMDLAQSQDRSLSNVVIQALKAHISNANKGK